MSRFTTYPQKWSILLLLLLISISNIVKAKPLPEGCFTISDCSQGYEDKYPNYNRAVFKFNEIADDILLSPLAIIYDDLTPDIVQTGINNFFKNLGEVTNIFNLLLQEKGNHAGVANTRLLLNSVLGIGGIFDIAGWMGIKRFDEDFGQTLATWGVESGSYIVLPLLGSSTIRGIGGRLGGLSTDPKFYYSYRGGRYSLELTALNIVQTRAKFIKSERLSKQIIGDKYTLLKDIYFQSRQYQIYDSNIPVGAEDDSDDDFDDDFFGE